MKNVIVKSSIVFREKTLDPEHYLGYEDNILKDITKRKIELKGKQTKLSILQKKLTEERKRLLLICREIGL